MNARPNPKRTKRPSRPIIFVVERLVRPGTGEAVGALVPSTTLDQRLMRERKYHIGTELRADLKNVRNVKFWRLSHVLSAWLADNVDGFDGLACHDALKKLQTDSGIGCAEESFDLGTLGKVTRTVAESLNFFDMDEGRFSELWDGGNGEGGWLGWLRRTKWGGLDPASVDEVEEMLRRENG